MSVAHARVDVVTAEIIRNGLNAAALEMSKTLVRTALNPLLYEVQDFGLAIVSSDGELWAEGSGGLTTFLGCLSDTIKTGLAKHGAAGFRDGDVLIVNDPYLTGTHLSDVTVYEPIFFDGDLVAFAAATAHWGDVGGKAPGGWCPDSTDVYQEGICLVHQKLASEGRENGELWELVGANVRFPDIVHGDLRAQIAACGQGVARVRALCEKYGTARVRAAMAFTIAQTDAAMRRLIETVPDGTYSAACALDGDGVTPGARPRLEVAFTVAGDRIRVSFEGTSEAARGPINEPAIGTASDVRATLKGLLAPLDPANEGHFLPFDIDLPPGLLVSPERPAPCDSYGYVGVALMNLSFMALAPALPGRTPAGGYQLFGIYLVRVDPRDGDPFILIDPLTGGDGARPHADGPSLIFLGDGDVSNTPVEVLETRYPIRCERHGLLPGAAGAGRYRGGPGVVREYRVLEPGISMQIAIENTRDPIARGLAGGETGEPSLVVVWPGTERERVMRERVSDFGPLAPGDVVSVRSGGGGGWGDARERDPERVARDVRDELVTVEEAREVYGVVVERVDGVWRAQRVDADTSPAR